MTALQILRKARALVLRLTAYGTAYLIFLCRSEQRILRAIEALEKGGK